MGRGLSAKEKNILLGLKDDFERLEKRVAELNQAMATDPDNHELLGWLRGNERLLHWGIRWRVTGSRSQAASISRSLRRLEQRGLVLRQNEIRGNPETGTMRESKEDPHARTINVQLTPEGRALAAEIASSG
jgi:hypothetical protein